MRPADVLWSGEKPGKETGTQCDTAQIPAGVISKKSGPSKLVLQEDVVKYLSPEKGLIGFEEVMRVARVLHHEELITIIQNGRPITDLNFKGPAQFIIKLG